MQAAVGWPFLWLLSFGHAKESNSPVGARTEIQMASQRETLVLKINSEKPLSINTDHRDHKQSPQSAHFRLV